jgi:dihydrolipoamide dehydrogenase
MALFGKDDLVGPLTDGQVIAAARDLFADEFEFHADAEVTRQERTGEAVEIDQTLDGGTRTHRFDHALVATGRRPNVDDLGLENTSLELDDHGVPVFDRHTTRCGDSAIFIAGDADNRLPLLHEAADEGMVAGYNAAHFPDVRRFSGSAPLTVVFTDPQIMMVGESHRALTEREAPFAVGSVEWAGQGRASVMGVDRGVLRVYGDLDSGKFLGAEMVGPAAEHIAHLLAWAHQSDLTVGAMLERPFYHPVLEEGVRSALRDLNYRMHMGPKPPPRCIDCGPGG